MTLTIVDEIREQELRDILQRRINSLREKLAISAEGVMLPQMQRQPREAGWPESPLRAVDGNRVGPDIGVVMRHRSAGTVKLARGIPARRAHPIHQIEQRQMHFREVA